MADPRTVLVIAVGADLSPESNSGRPFRRCGPAASWSSTKRFAAGHRHYQGGSVSNR